MENNPNSWRIIKLRDIATLVGGGTPNRRNPAFFRGDVPWVTGGDFSVEGISFIENAREYITSDAIEVSATNPVPPGTVLLTTRVSVGKVGITEVRLCFSQDITALIIKNKNVVDSHFLAYFLLANQEQLLRFNRGTTISGIRREDLARFQIPLPTLPEQQEIVKILLQADHLRKLRATADSQSELLAASVFNQIFGSKDKTISYPNSKLGKIAEVVSGVTKGRNLPAHETVNVPYLRVANVQAGHLDLTEIKTIDVLPSDVEKYALQPGDVLLTEGGDFDKLGRGAILEQEIPNCIHQNHVFRVRVNTESLLPLFFHYYLQTAHARQYFLRAAKRTTNLASINITQLNAMPVPIPPLPLQEKFTNAVNQIRSMLKTQASTANELDRLFKSTMVSAFTGNLTRGYRERNLLELSRLAKDRDEVLSQPAGQLELQQSESISGIKRSFVRDTLSPSQQALLASIETQGIYLPSGRSEVVGNLPPNEVSRNLELLVQLGLIKVASIPATPGKLGQIFYTTAYRSLRPKDNVRDTDLQTMPKALQE